MTVEMRKVLTPVTESAIIIIVKYVLLLNQA